MICDGTTKWGFLTCWGRGYHFVLCSFNSLHDRFVTVSVVSPSNDDRLSHLFTGLQRFDSSRSPPLSSHWHMLLQDIRAASLLCWIVAPSAHDLTVTLRTQPANLFGMKPSALCRKTCMHIFIFLLQLKHGKSYSNQRLCHVLRRIWDSCYSKQTMQHRTGSASSFACGCAALL